MIARFFVCIFRMLQRHLSFYLVICIYLYTLNKNLRPKSSTYWKVFNKLLLFVELIAYICIYKNIKIMITFLLTSIFFLSLVLPVFCESILNDLPQTSKTLLPNTIHKLKLVKQLSGFLGIVFAIIFLYVCFDN